MDAVTDALIAIATSPLIYLVIFAICAIDGFFPPVPSEMAVVAVAAVAASTGQPALVILIAVSALGAIAGDNLAYAIGRKVGTTRYRWMRRPRAVRVFGWAERELKRRPASLVFTARYIPVGRIAVNMTAGATRLPHKRFFGLTVIAGVAWAIYSVLIALLAGAVFGHNPLGAAALGIVLAIGAGLIIDRVMSRVEPTKAKH